MVTLTSSRLQSSPGRRLRQEELNKQRRMNRKNGLLRLWMNVSDVAQVCFECLGAELLVEDMA